MDKTVKCPCCRNGVLDIHLANGYVVDWDKPFKEYTYRTICPNCLRTIKYSVKKLNKTE